MFFLPHTSGYLCRLLQLLSLSSSHVAVPFSTQFSGSCRSCPPNILKNFIQFFSFFGLVVPPLFPNAPLKMGLPKSSRSPFSSLRLIGWCNFRFTELGLALLSTRSRVPPTRTVPPPLFVGEVEFPSPSGNSYEARFAASFLSLVIPHPELWFF